MTELWFVNYCTVLRSVILQIVIKCGPDTSKIFEDLKFLKCTVVALLVGGLEHFLLSHILGTIIPID